MRTIPTIGGAGGIFEVFVPGLFLLLNFIGVIYLLPLPNESINRNLIFLFSNPALSIVIAIGFGYLMGVILRIFRAENSDKWSSKYLRKFDSNCRNKENRNNLYGYQKFPYIGWLGVISQRSMPKDVREFYYDFWANFKLTDMAFVGLKKDKSIYKVPEQHIDKLEDLKNKLFRSRKAFLKAVRNRIGEQDKKIEEGILRYACLWARPSDRSFFNFCKVMIISSDNNLANEINSRASLSRYISAMFYALFLASCLILITIISQLIFNGNTEIVLILLVFLYILAIIAILRNLRFMRLSEVQTVFYASYKIRDVLITQSISNNLQDLEADTED